MADNNTAAESTWEGYAFATVVTGAVFVFRFELNRLTGSQISVPLCGLAAVLASMWKAGAGPALFASVLTTAWCAWDSHAARTDAWIHCALYAAEAGAFCLYGRQLRVAKYRAAQGEDWQRHLVQTASEGIWTVRPDGVIGYSNSRIAEILGCGADQITGRKVEEFLFPEDHLPERIRFQNRRAGVKEQYDRRLRRADGSEVWTLACSTPYSRGEYDAGLLTMMTDITERKKAEHALRLSERKFRELFENIREGVYQTSPDGRILAANPELLRMLGFSNREELNVPGVVRDFFVDTDLHQRLQDRLERDGSYANVGFQLRRRDQRIITVRENARVVRDENGEVLYYEGTLTDVTERMRVESQLRQSEKMDALGQIAGGIAHDFRGIGVGMTAALKQALDVLAANSSARPILDAVAKKMDSAEALTRQILEFSRDARRRANQGESGLAFDLNALIAEMQSQVRPDTRLEITLCNEPTPVRADPGLVRHVIVSLLTQLSEIEGGTTGVSIATAIEGDVPTTVCLSVRMESTLPASAWVSMATSQAILAQYGGTIVATIERASSGAEAGVRYSLCLPLATGARLAVAPAPETPTTTTVLLVEKEPLIREVGRDMLERQGFRVLTTGSPDEAERIGRGAQTIEVLIIGWEPEGGGSAALVQCFRETRPNLSVLYIAGDSDGQADSIAVPPHTAVLSKPFSGDSLGGKIRQLLEQSPPAGT